MIQRSGDVVIRMLENVKQVTIKALIEPFIKPGALVYTDEYAIYNKLVAWGYGHKSVRHGVGEWLCCMNQNLSRLFNFCKKSCKFFSRWHAKFCHDIENVNSYFTFGFLV